MIANTGKLAGRTIFISGASRGIGKSIALKAAKDGANIVVVAKTAEPHPKLPGTIYTAAKEIEAAGGRALPCTVDVRDENQVNNAVKQAVNEFGGIDIVINNASAISLTDTLSTDMKKYDLMNSINARGTFLVSKACLPFLKKSENPHIINLSPPINLNPKWFSNNLAYTMSKYGMSMCAIGMAEEFKKDGIAVNAIWPKTAIHTAAIEMLAGPEASNSSRKPEIVADAVYAMLCKDSKTFTGQLLIDEDVLKNEGITDFTSYACNPDNKDNLMLDFFLDTDGSSLHYKSIIPDEGKQGSASVEDSKNEQLNTIFSTIRLNLSADLVQKIGATYQFNITGEDEGSWFLDLKNGTGALVKGPSSQSPETSLTLEAKNFFELFTGKIKPATAYMMGKVRVEGNLQNAMKLEKLMKSLKAKL